MRNKASWTSDFMISKCGLGDSSGKTTTVAGALLVDEGAHDSSHC